MRTGLAFMTALKTHFKGFRDAGHAGPGAAVRALPARRAKG